MIQKVKFLIQESKSIVVFSGIKLMQESGLLGVRAEEKAYEIEKGYGYSPEEIITYDFFQRRTDLFYKYYKEFILDVDKMHPTEAHFAIAKLEQQGKLNAVITREIYGLHQMAGVSSVIELLGSVQMNICPKCLSEYPLEYVYQSQGMPICGTCKTVLRPEFSFFGDSIDNAKISQSADCVSQSDLLIVAGTTMTSSLTKSMLQYYNGDKVILINNQREYGDDWANCVLYGDCKDILPQLI